MRGHSFRVFLGWLSVAIAARPHIIFILVDDMGFNDFYTSSDLARAWPNVAKLASEDCVRLDSYYTQPLCTPTRGAFMTGRMPIRLGLQHAVINGFQNYGLPLDEVTLAEKMLAASYSTIGVGKWHLGIYNNASRPTRRGFQHFYGYMNGYEDYWTHEVDGYLDLSDDEAIDRGQRNVYSAHLFTAKLQERILEHKLQNVGMPLFVYVPLQMVHSPLEAPDEYKSNAACSSISNKDRKTFCGMAKAADDAIGNLTTTLNVAFPGEDVVIVISGDNGGAPHAAGNNCPDFNSFCLRGGKGTLWEGGIRNNALLCSKTLLPDDRKGTTYSKGLVHVMDWHATLRDLAGAVDLVGKPTDGVSVWEAVAKDEASPRTEFLVNIDPCAGLPPGTGPCQGAESAYRLGDWKLLLGARPERWYPVPTSASALPTVPDDSVGAASPRYADQLFNITADPQEIANVAHEFPEVVAEIRAKITALGEEALEPCNLPGGSCFESDSKGEAVCEELGAWVPWVPDPVAAAGESLLVV